MTRCAHVHINQAGVKTATNADCGTDPRPVQSRHAAGDDSRPARCAVPWASRRLRSPPDRRLPRRRRRPTRCRRATTRWTSSSGADAPAVTPTAPGSLNHSAAGRPAHRRGSPEYPPSRRSRAAGSSSSWSRTDDDHDVAGFDQLLDRVLAVLRGVADVFLARRRERRESARCSASSTSAVSSTDSVVCVTNADPRRVAHVEALRHRATFSTRWMRPPPVASNGPSCPRLPGGRRGRSGSTSRPSRA